MQSDSPHYPERSPTLFDPQTDTVYDLEHGLSKRMVFKDQTGKTLVTPNGQEARLYHLWNSSARGIMGLSPVNPQVVLSEGILGLVGKEASLTADPAVHTAQQVMNQFCIGLGLYFARKHVRVEIESDTLSPEEIEKVRKKFGNDEGE
ncbi:MAG: hypothetical protein DRQ98_13115 [Gammaproteobacteria bacterium]|nr:MAG: hypothetical protein DRQ98_13115 [Gammaproteobacteria bacterium]